MSLWQVRLEVADCVIGAVGAAGGGLTRTPAACPGHPYLGKKFYPNSGSFPIAHPRSDRLHEKGMIADPRNKTKSLALTPEGLERAERVFHDLFERRPTD